jgi:hypothetical protein
MVAPFHCPVWEYSSCVWAGGDNPYASTVRQTLKVLFETLSVLLLGYAVHADGFVSVKRFVAGTQVVQIRSHGDTMK